MLLLTVVMCVHKRKRASLGKTGHMLSEENKETNKFDVSLMIIEYDGHFVIV